MTGERRTRAAIKLGLREVHAGPEDVAEARRADPNWERNHESLALGVSPRGTQALYRATQALALCEGRDYAIPDDVKRLAVPVFAHRVVINTRVALAQRTTELAERVLQEILTQVEVPL